MKSVCLLGLFAAFSLGLLKTATVENPLELLRQGNAAYEREDFSQAADNYGRAEERTSDPGLVAFNKAAALYRLGQFQEATAHYERCLADATGARRAQALYGLGNCLLHQGGGQGQPPLERAMACYRACLRQDGAEADLLHDAAHNLELAKLLWLQAKPPENRGQPPEQSEDQDPSKPPPEKKQGSQEGGDQGDGGRKPEPGADKTQAQPQPGQQPIPTDEQGAPGAGQLPPIPDKEDLVPLDQDAAAEHLRRAGERVLRAERERAERGKDPASVLDR